MFLSLILSITLAISPVPAPSTSDILVAELRDQLAVLVADRDITAGLNHVRILRPINLAHASVPGHRPSLPTPHAHGYEPLPTDPPITSAVAPPCPAAGLGLP